MGEKGAKPDLDGSDLRIAVVVARFNEDITKLQASHAETLEKLETATAEKDAFVKSMATVTDTITALKEACCRGRKALFLMLHCWHMSGLL